MHPKIKELQDLKAKGDKLPIDLNVEVEAPAVEVNNEIDVDAIVKAINDLSKYDAALVKQVAQIANKDDGIAKAIGLLANALKLENNVEIDLKPLIDAIGKIELNKKPSKYRFEVERTNQGFIKEVIAIPYE